MKTLIIIVLGLLVLSFVIVGFYIDKKQTTNNLNKLYQGPVPEGYDEKYFRETGITKPLETEEDK